MCFRSNGSRNNNCCSRNESMAKLNVERTQGLAIQRIVIIITNIIITSVTIHQRTRYTKANTYKNIYIPATTIYAEYIHTDGKQCMHLVDT